MRQQDWPKWTFLIVINELDCEFESQAAWFFRIYVYISVVVLLCYRYNFSQIYSFYSTFINTCICIHSGYMYDNNALERTLLL